MLVISSRSYAILKVNMKLMGYSDSSHNVDIDDGRSTTEHFFYLGTSPITWCSQKQTVVALSSCEVEFMAASYYSCVSSNLAKGVIDKSDKVGETE
ncbi:hypothetical protein Tco_0181441, partial [Tanacetum coccineum]